jgi:hypothetical protein
MSRRIVQVRATLAHQRKPIGARTIHRELNKRRLKPCPSLRTIQRVLQRKGLTLSSGEAEAAYRPHPEAEYPNAVQATDIVTRWLTGGAVVQTFTTVDHFTNAAYATAHPHKRIQAARDHLLKTWAFQGLPDLAQFDNESAFSGGRYAQQLSPIIRLCLYVGCDVLFTPEYEADYNWEVETFNRFASGRVNSGTSLSFFSVAGLPQPWVGSWLGMTSIMWPHVRRTLPATCEKANGCIICPADWRARSLTRSRCAEGGCMRFGASRPTDRSSFSNKLSGLANATRANMFG